MKFEIETTRVDRHEITIDPKIWTKQEIKEWSKVFVDVSDLEELAEYISVRLMRVGEGQYIDGFGHIKQLYSEGHEFNQYDESGKKVTEFAKGILVKLLVSDEDYCTEIVNKNP